MTPPLARVLGWLVPRARGMVFGVALQVLTLGAGVALMATSAWLIARAAQRPSIAALQVAIVGVRFFGISRGAARYLERLVTHGTTLRLVSEVRLRVFRALAPLAPARLAEHRTGDLLARLVGDVDTVDHVYLRVLAPMAAAVSVLAGVSLLLLAFDPRLAWVAILGWFAAGVVAPLAARAIARGAGRDLVSRRADLQARAVDGVQGVAELVAFGADERYVAAVAHTVDAVAAAERRAARSSAVGTALGVAAVDATTIAVLAACVPLVGEGAVGAVNLAVITLTTIAAFEALTGLPAAWQGLDATAAAATRLCAVLDEAPAVVPARASVALPPSPAIEVRRLRFTYPGASSRAIDDLSFRLEPGRMVAVVGPSGAGKSTIAHLLLRFWDVPPGSVFIGHVDVRHADPDGVRRLFGYAGQSAHVFTGTIRENLLVGRASATTGDLDRATAAAHFGPVVAACPAGYDTWVGEQGYALSGGERQRLALARAFLADTPYLLLDEPTAHLDPETERNVLDSICASASKRGVLLITHRLAGLARADEIIVLRAGAVVERGTFHELVAHDGVFRRMIDLQRSIGVVEGGPTEPKPGGVRQ